MPALPETFACYLVRKPGKDHIEASLERRPLVELPPGDVLVRVEFSSLNYKDALAAMGHPGVVRKFPHIPGIDAAGTVAASSTAQVKVGEKVIVTSYELGSGRFGAWAEYIRVPADWIVPLPAGLSMEEAMTYGTAGFTAAKCVLALKEHHITPDKGDIVVTGATGGVGLFAVQFLAQLGYAVTAVSGKPDKEDWLISLGAERVIDRGEVSDDSDKPLLSARWAGARRGLEAPQFEPTWHQSLAQRSGPRNPSHAQRPTRGKNGRRSLSLQRSALDFSPPLPISPSPPLSFLTSGP
jgi:putative YhdH/YhfP family quinone oxidoreductase